MPKNNLLKMNIQLLASKQDEEIDENETIEEKLIKMQEQLLKMNDIIEENNRLKNVNDTLFNKNQEYYLKITGQKKEEGDINEYEEYVGDEFYKKLSNKEKKQLQIILEGEDE